MTQREIHSNILTNVCFNSKKHRMVLFSSQRLHETWNCWICLITNKEHPEVKGHIVETVPGKFGGDDFISSLQLGVLDFLLHEILLPCMLIFAAENFQTDAVDQKMKLELQVMKIWDTNDKNPFITCPRNDPTWVYITALHREDQNLSNINVNPCGKLARVYPVTSSQVMLILPSQSTLWGIAGVQTAEIGSRISEYRYKLQQSHHM